MMSHMSTTTYTLLTATTPGPLAHKALTAAMAAIETASDVQEVWVDGGCRLNVRVNAAIPTPQDICTDDLTESLEQFAIGTVETPTK